MRQVCYGHTVEAENKAVYNIAIGDREKLLSNGQIYTMAGKVIIMEKFDKTTTNVSMRLKM